MNDKKKNPRILGFIQDLMFTTRLEDVAARLGFETSWIDHRDQITASSAMVHDGHSGALLPDEGGMLVDEISAMAPALIIFDLNFQDIPFQEWISILKSSPATLRIPIICFGSHKNIETMQTAKQAGADLVVARSRFVNGLPDLITKYARIIDQSALQESCLLPLSPEALAGIELFNQREYFEAHELLEGAWREDNGPGRELYRAILQVAVAYLQIQRKNFPGAVKMFLRLRQWIDPLPDECRGVNVAKLRTDSEQVYLHLIAQGNQGISGFDFSLLKPIEFRS